MRRHTLKGIFAAVVTLLLVKGESFAQKRLTYEQVFERKGPQLLRQLPQIVGWLDDQCYLEVREDTTQRVRKLYRVDALSGTSEVYLDPLEFRDVLPEGFQPLNPTDRTPDFRVLIFSKDADLYLLDTRAHHFRRLTANPGEEKNPTLSPDGQWVAFTRDSNLFALEIASGLEYQLTSDGGPTVYNGWASWVYYEEILGRASRYRAFWWSPDSKRLAFLRFDDSPVPTFPVFHAGPIHGELETERYPKAGDPNPRVRLGIVNVRGGEIVWADFDPEADEYIAWPFWLPKGEALVVQWMNREQTDLRVYRVDLQNGKKTLMYQEHQDSWVEFLEDLHFLGKEEAFIVRSDVDGWRHLYVYGLDGKLRRRLTKGEWSVTGIELVDEQRGYVYFTGNQGESTETHLFRVSLSGGSVERLTTEAGTHRPRLSPGGSYFLDTFSSIDCPPRIDLYRTTGELVRRIGDSRTPEMSQYALGRVELFRIPISGGYQLPARWILPPDFDPKKKYPLILSIYGGPGSGTVQNSFPMGLRDFYFAQQGAIVLSVDHRGSGHFGKKGMAQMHRQLGKWEMNDWMEAIRWILRRGFVDSTRVGIIGGSYGGYATLLALTVGARYFTHGISLYPVTDWHLYDTVYTERYMDRPEENPEGYRLASVLTHADSLRGKLLLVHGTTDDNVHLQNTLQLVDKLQLLNKPFELMLYPEERHGIGARSRHLQRLIYEFWVRHGFLRPEGE
ncbi:MAG: S9 family peptidase [candidate division KSB1 bacterium]|nr:S9 family peptidase [candidate division KSB1 bacterium]